MTYLTWSEIERAIEVLANEITRRYNIKEFKGIVCVGRGGMVPARLLADRLEIHMMRIFRISRYEDRSQEKRKAIDFEFSEQHVPPIEGRWLVVDDLIDSGDTYRYLMTQIPDSLYVVIAIKNLEFLDKPNVMFYRKMSKSDWVIFPWDAYEHSCDM